MAKKGPAGKRSDEAGEGEVRAKIAAPVGPTAPCRPSAWSDTRSRDPLIGVERLAERPRGSLPGRFRLARSIRTPYSFG
jgi:hypothetical protein